MTYRVRALSLSGGPSLRKEMAALGVSHQAIPHMADKGQFFLLRAEGLSPVAANILKQDMLSRGGEAAVHAGVIVHQVEKSGVLLMGTLPQYTALIEKLKQQQFGLPRLAEEIQTVLKNQVMLREWQVPYSGGCLELGKRTLVMGIVNVTPDSFSDGGDFFDVERAIQHGLELAAAGADILDIGGESTRPGAALVTAEEELARVLPVIQGLRGKTTVPISIDTYKPEVARAALLAGAHILNDVWGMQWEGDSQHEMAAVASEFAAPIVVMHNQTGTDYQDIMGDMIDFFQRSIDIGLNQGMKREQIILDPGIGFGKTPEQNLEVLARMKELTALGCPLLLGVSRKSMISYCLTGDNTAPIQERIFGTAAAVTLGIQNGADIIRVHDVTEMLQAVKVTDKIVRK
ncbi:MAG: dihydropteroate synthase [Peptococcaceae bacterium]|nr:dihydropteroate synthase [Peptococcaceae bacterium]